MELEDRNILFFCHNLNYCRNKLCKTIVNEILMYRRVKYHYQMC